MYVYKDGMSLEEQKDGAYWERNMLVLLCAHYTNLLRAVALNHDIGLNVDLSGWYYDTENNWDGWKRVISLDGGRYGFHIPDDFDVGNLPQIENNYDGHATEDKWSRVMALWDIREYTEEDEQNGQK